MITRQSKVITHTRKGVTHFPSDMEPLDGSRSPRRTADQRKAFARECLLPFIGLEFKRARRNSNEKSSNSNKKMSNSPAKSDNSYEKKRNSHPQRLQALRWEPFAEANSGPKEGIRSRMSFSIYRS